MMTQTTSTNDSITVSSTSKATLVPVTSNAFHATAIMKMMTDN